MRTFLILFCALVPGCLGNPSKESKHGTDAINDLKSEISFLKKQYEDIKKVTEQLATKNELMQLSNEVNELSSRVTTPIAFSAYVSYDRTFGYQQTVVFDTVYSNVGNAYSTTTGVFTCPNSGTYMFSYSCGPGIPNHCGMELVMNGTPYATAYADVDDEHYQQGAITVVIACDAGNQVSIRQGYDADTTIGTRLFDSLVVNIFTGVLLFEDV